MKTKCISCIFLVPDEKLPGKGKCWWVPADKRVQLDTFIERECKGYKLGVMDNVRNRKGWKP